MKVAQILMVLLCGNFTLTTFGIIYNLLFTATLLYIVFTWDNKKTFSKNNKNNVPGPLCLPIIGYGYRLAMLKSDDVIDHISDLLKRYNGFLKISFGPKQIYLISKPQHCEKILNNSKALEKDYLYKFITHGIGRGLMTADVKTWKKHRKAIMPAFNQKVLDSYVEIFEEHAIVLKKQLEKVDGRRDIDIYQYISRCTLDVICDTAMGLKMGQQELQSDFGANLDRLQELVQTRIFQFWYHLDFSTHITPLGWEYKAIIKKFRNFVGDVIKTKLKAREENLRNQNDPSQPHEDTPKKLAFLDLIMDNPDFTFEELENEVKIFIIAGTDTTAGTLSAILMLLGMYPEVQQEVLDEVLAVVGPDREILPSDLPLLKYTERVIKESSRLFPVGAYFLRQLDDDIDIGDAVIPGGSSVMFNALYINRNPEVWPDPLKFDPDRFLPENVKARHPCSFISFSSGPRNCIGARYAILNMKVIIATLIRKLKFHCEFKSVSDIRLKAYILLKCRDGYNVWVEKRT